MPRGKHGNHARGSSHPRWNAGRIESSTGYTKVRIGVAHPLADPNGYAYEHLLVWCAAGRDKPADDEVLHHENGDKCDNRIENLTLKKRSQHSVEHGGGLSDAAVLAIREAYAAGEADMPTLAARFGVPASRVSRIIRGETRRSVGGPTSTDNRGKTRVGKKAASRLLDGREWNEMPGTTGGAS